MTACIYRNRYWDEDANIWERHVVDEIQEQENFPQAPRNDVISIEYSKKSNEFV